MATMVDFFKINSLSSELQRAMEGASDTAETSMEGINRSKRQKGSDNEQEDRISNLPDSILLHILSFLPMEEAVNTVLLRRFGNLWTSVQTLDFDYRYYNDPMNTRYNQGFTKFVYRVLQSHECPTIIKFSLKFGSYLYFLPKNIKPRRERKPLEPEFSCDIDACICFVVRKKVKVLDFGILAHDSSSSRFDYELPRDVLTSEFIEELKLVNIGLKQGQIDMKSLKVLSLTSIQLEATMIEGILSGCPLLGSLSIIKCYGWRKMNCMLKHLKNLTVDVGEYVESGLEISGPNLSSLHISGMNSPLDLKNLSSLVEATLDLYRGGGREDAFFYTGELLEKLHHAHTITIFNGCILAVSFWNLKAVPCPSSSRKCLILKTVLTMYHLPGIITLLRTSHFLERLIIYIEADAAVRDDDLQLGVPGDLEEYNWNTEPWFKANEFDVEQYLNSQEPCSCLTNHLKTVKISGSVSNPNLQALIKFLLRRSNFLEKMMISEHSSHSISKDLQEFSQNLSRCPKASRDAVILFT